MNVDHNAEEKSDHKAEKVGDDESFAHEHENGDKHSLENVCPCAQGKSGQHFRKCVGNARDSRDAGAGIKHQHHAEAVDDDGENQSQLSAEYVMSFICQHVKSLPVIRYIFIIVQCKCTIWYNCTV